MNIYVRILVITFVFLLLNPKFTIKGSSEEPNIFPTRGEEDDFANSVLIGNRIIFDESHRQSWSVWDTGFFGLSHLATILMDLGFSVSTNSKSLSDVLPGLGEGDVLVLGMARDAQYSEGEIQGICDFVSSGGGVLIVGEHDNIYNSSDFQNPLSTNFGITFNPDHIYDTEKYNELAPTDALGKWILVSQPELGLDEICFYFSCSLNLTDNATAFLTSSSYSEVETFTSFNRTQGPVAVAATSTYKEGRVMAFSDTQFLLNGDDVMGIQYGDNAFFLERAFKWCANSSGMQKSLKPDYSLFTADSFQLELQVDAQMDIEAEISGGKIIPQAHESAFGLTIWNISVFEDGYVKFKGDNANCIVYFLKPTTNEYKVLFYENNYCRKTDTSISGMLCFANLIRNQGITAFSSSELNDHEEYDAILVINPLKGWEDEKDIASLLDSNKLILIGEEYSSLLAREVFPIWLRDREFRDIDNPLNDIAAEKNVNFTTYLVYDPINNYDKDPFSPSLLFSEGNMDIYGHKSAVVLGDKDKKIWMEGKKGSWGEAPRFGYVTAEYSKDGHDLEVTSVVISDSRLLAMGDADILTNQYISSEARQQLTEAIANWIKAPVKESKNDTFSWEISSLIIIFFSIILISFIKFKRGKGRTK